jgi:hypothetical protein
MLPSKMTALQLCLAILSLFVLPALSDETHQVVLSHHDYHAFKCQNFASTLSLPNVTVNFATWLPAGTVIQLEQGYGLASCG